jgi:hypothetical protein
MYLRAQQLTRHAGILAEADAAHERSMALAVRALELETAQNGFSFEEIVGTSQYPAANSRGTNVAI